jgi:hypothetical protein
MIHKTRNGETLTSQRILIIHVLKVTIQIDYFQLVDELLDVNENPRKPQYEMAPEWPLVLYDCGFEGITFQDNPGRTFSLKHVVLENLSCNQWITRKSEQTLHTFSTHVERVFY